MGINSFYENGNGIKSSTPYNYNKFNNNYSKNSNIKNEPHLTERKIGGILFLITSVILCSKLFGSLKSFIVDQLQWRTLVVTDVIDSWGIKMHNYKWETGITGSDYFIPFICGLAVSIFTWMIVYLDSDVIGLHPPIPFSPVKDRCTYRKQVACHMGYMMAIASGLTVFFLLLLT